MQPYLEFIDRLIYGTGAEAQITPSHTAWRDTNPSPTGTDWIAHHLDRMLPAYEAWLASHHLPPLQPWDGTRPEPWDPASLIPLGTDLDGSFTGISSLDQLGDALRSRLGLVGVTANELNGAEKAPYSYRFWGYLKWADVMRRRFGGASAPAPAATMYDRDGTVLSPIPFCDVFNELHWRWHNSDGGTPLPSAPTPGFDTTVGQRAREGGVGMTMSEEFIRFHRDHLELFTRWLARTGQPPVRGTNMVNFGGWPPIGAGNPSTWVEFDERPFINNEFGDSDNELRAAFASLDALGTGMNTGSGGDASVHAVGHIQNTDIASIFHNNYVPRFHAWHGWIDNQWTWRAPRFARYDASTGLRERIFAPVLQSGDEFPGLAALTIVRDPLASDDVLAPANAIAGLNFSTGAGSLRMKLLVQDSYARQLRLQLRADVFADGTSTTVPVETLPLATHTYLVGDTSAGDDFALGTEFTVDFAFAGAFQSDDPTRSSPSVGFVNSRIRITGTLEVADGSDPGFVHEEHVEIALVQEKVPPQLDVFLDLASFGEDQVISALADGESRFSGALIVAVQDRTSAPASIAWPSEVADEVKGLLTGPVPSAGLFEDPAHAPSVEIRDGGSPIAGLRAELAEGPILEDPTLADNLPQRYLYRYDVVFDETNDAFTDLVVGGERVANVELAVADRAGNGTTAATALKLFRAANPFMRDGNPSWVSIDTRVFQQFEGDTRFNTTLASGQPEAFIQQVLTRLNTGAAGTDTFDALPTNQDDSTLEYSATVSTPAGGTPRTVHNFAIAKVRLRGAAGAADVRAFFRLFRYTASNLIFDDTTGYRTHTGGGAKVPLLGFSTASAGGDVISIPCFAEPRVPYANDMRTQTDAPNVQTFTPGPTAERVLYFGVYLDINQTDARLPSTFLPAHPDGGFAVSEVQSIRSLMSDAHQCMVVELHYEGDPTAPGATPADSDNLAQRNLVILTTDNPGAPLTHTVEHSVELDTGRRLRAERPPLEPLEFGAFLSPDTNAPRRPPAPLPSHRPPLKFISQDGLRRRAMRRTTDVAMLKAKTMMEMMMPMRFLGEAMRFEQQHYPFVFDRTDWQDTGEWFDELLILWGDLPADCEAQIYLPAVDVGEIINLRHLRHAPDDVAILDQHTLSLTPRGATFLPLPSPEGDRVPAVITVALPKGIKTGQRWRVDALQLRGGERRVTGGFQLDIQVSKAELIVAKEQRLLEHMLERLSLLPPEHVWHPVLARRVETLRARAQALADAAGVPHEDPSTWTDARGERQPIVGQRLRVVLERIEIIDDHDPWLKGAGEFRFRARVHTPDNGGQTQDTLLPAKGCYRLSDLPGRNQLVLEEELFSGYVAGELRVELQGVELDTFDPDDAIGKYTRVFSGTPPSWYGRYGPSASPIDPEDQQSWRLHYRIERT